MAEQFHGHDSYQYHLRDFNPRSSIRLLKVLNVSSTEGQLHAVECKLAAWDLPQNGIPQEEFPRFNAISYTWGDTRNMAPVMIKHGTSEAHVLMVAQNCEDALKQAWQYDKTAWYWIDSICIDQHSQTEKEHQVPLMGEIYGKAEVVLACVGQHALGSKDLFEFVHLNSGILTENSILLSTATGLKLPEWLPQAARSQFPLLKVFLNRAYFSRLWVFQEVCLARKVLFCCGHDCVPATDLCGILRPLQNRFLDSTSGDLGTLPLTTEVLEISASSGKITMPFWEALSRVAETDLQSKDVKDRIFGILAVVNWNDKKPIVPDYGINIFDLAVTVLRKLIELQEIPLFLINATAMARLIGKVLRLFDGDFRNGFAGAVGQRKKPVSTITRDIWQDLIQLPPKTPSKISTDGVGTWPEGYRLENTGSGWRFDGGGNVEKFQVFSYDSTSQFRASAHKWKHWIVLPKAARSGDWCVFPSAFYRLSGLVFIVRPAPVFRNPILFEFVGLGLSGILTPPSCHGTGFQLVLSIEDAFYLATAAHVFSAVLEGFYSSAEALSQTSDILSAGLCGQQGSSFAVRADWWASARSAAVLESVEGEF